MLLSLFCEPFQWLTFNFFLKNIYHLFSVNIKTKHIALTVPQESFFVFLNDYCCCSSSVVLFPAMVLGFLLYMGVVQTWVWSVACTVLNQTAQAAVLVILVVFIVYHWSQRVLGFLSFGDCPNQGSKLDLCTWLALETAATIIGKETVGVLFFEMVQC